MRRMIFLKILFTSIVLLISNIFQYSYEKVVLWDGKELNLNDLNFDGKSFKFEKNKQLDKDTISYIVFNLKDEEDSKDKLFLQDISVDELLKRAEILGKDYPDSSLLVLYDDGIQKLNKDSTRYTRSRYSVKIMNEKDLSSYSVLSFYYAKGDYETNIIQARSISPDGSVSYLEKSDISYTKQQQDLSYFSGRKDDFIIKATIPNVKVGSIIDFEYEVIESSPEDPNQFYTSWYFGGDNPVFESKIKFIVPEDKNFYYVIKNFNKDDKNPVITTNDGYKIYSFVRDKCPPFVPEPNSPPIEELYPAVFGSQFKDQTYLSNWLSNLMKERMVSNDKMNSLINQIIEKANAKSEEEKITVLYRFVQEYIHYRSIKTSLSSGFSGHPATETFENRYGDCIDKAIFFSTVLGIAGVEAYPVIVSTNDNPRPLYNEIGVITGNHAITEIHLKDKKIIYLDSTSLTYRYPTFRYDDQGIPVWNPILNTVREINPMDAIWNTQEYEKEVILDSDGNAEIKSYSIYSGDWEAGLREYFLSLKEKEIKSVLGTLVARDYPGSVLEKYEFRNPTDFSNNFFLKLYYKALNIGKKTGSFLIMNLPVNYDFEFVSFSERKYPLVFKTKEGKKNKISIMIPDDYKIKGLPGAINISNKYFTYKASYKQEKDKIIFEDHFERNACRILPNEYGDFRKEILRVDYFIRNPLIFKEKK